MNQFQIEFSNRDRALEYIMRDANIHLRSLDDYEILDRSDYL
jgi:hypothetical protein